MRVQLDVRKWKIKYKLTAAMYIVLIPVLFGITFYIYVQGLQTVKEELINAYESLVVTIDANVAYIESDVEDIITYVVINDDFRYVLNSNAESDTAKNPLIWQQETPAEFVSEMLYVKNYIQCFALYPANGIRPYINARNNAVIAQDYNEIQKMEFAQSSKASLGDISIMKMDAGDTSLIKDNKKDRVVFGKAVMSYSKAKTLGYICTVINAEDITKTFKRDRLEENESIYLYDSVGNEIIHSGSAPEQALEFIRSEGKSGIESGEYQEAADSYIFCSKNKEYGYSIFYIVPKENWTRQLKNAGRVPIFIAIALFFAAFPIFSLVTRFITIPLGNLHESMLRLKEGDFKQKVPVYADDEMGDVTKVYNDMVKHIDELIDKNYVMVLRERESELDILQAQINPHFLYNTLDSLYWDALNVENTELAENIMALSELFRLALSRGKGIVTVETEFKLVESYLRIQKMRFEKKMDYKINLLSEMKEYEIPKLIIQPFVENAIVHGLENTSNIGFINVHGYIEDDAIIFKISDNGVGMNEEQLQYLFAEDSKQYSNQRISKYAIKNVRERLKLRYHDDFSLQITSALGMGTTITLKLPKHQ